MKEMTDIPVSEMKSAVTAINALLETGKIKTVGKRKEDICAAFKGAIEKFIAEDKVDTLPDNVVDFFNDYIADDEEPETPAPGKGTGRRKEDGKTAPPAKGKTAPPAKGVKNTEGKAPAKEKKVREVSNESREASIVKALKTGGTKSEIIKNADEIYVGFGGSSNESQSAKLLDRGLKYFKAAGTLVVNGDKFSIK